MSRGSKKLTPTTRYLIESTYPPHAMARPLHPLSMTERSSWRMLKLINQISLYKIMIKLLVRIVIKKI